MIVEEAVAIGLGGRKGALASDIAALVTHAMQEAGLATDTPLRGLFTLARKRNDPVWEVAAQMLGLRVHFVDEAILAAQMADFMRRGVGFSNRTYQAVGLGNVAECCALYGAGAKSVLLAPRRVGEGLTCALAGPERLRVVYAEAVSRESWDIS